MVAEPHTQIRAHTNICTWYDY